ncbi:MAG: ElyC/SanA/YdcF family protein [Atribacterota bacterium]
MNNNIQNIGIICGYGVILNNNLKEYLNSVIEYINNYKINIIILSGGFTLKNSDVSEAQVMFDYIKSKINIKILKEENSHITFHNLQYSQSVIDKLQLSKYKLYIFCDNLRFIKVFLLSKIVFKNKETNVIKIKRKEKLIEYLIQIPSTIYQLIKAICFSLKKLSYK